MRLDLKGMFRGRLLKGTKDVTDNAKQSLKAIELLKDLGDDALVELEKGCSWKKYSSHEQILDRQSESQDVFFVTQGAVRVIIYTISGREVTLDDLEEGSYFGELAAIDQQPRSASVMALGETMVATMSPQRFAQMVRDHPQVAMKVMQKLAWVVRMSNERIMDLSTLGANNRVHAELLRQARIKMDDNGQAVLKPIPVHSDVASRVSTTRETVARVMNDLARRGILERQKDRLVVLDVDKLEEMVEEVRGE